MIDFFSDEMRRDPYPVYDQLRSACPVVRVPPPFDAPYSFEIFELFKIVDGRIVRVEAVLDPVPYGMKSSW